MLVLLRSAISPRAEYVPLARPGRSHQRGRRVLIDGYARRLHRGRTVVTAWPLAFAVLLVGACATAGHDVAVDGRRAIVGMDADTLQACAGIPTRTKRLDPRTEIFSYEIKNENVGGMQFSVPLVGGGFKIAGSGSYCNTIIRVVDGKVAEVTYTGDNDDFVGKEGVCAPIVRGCLRAHGNHAETSSR
ncbi:MAG: hypothetical protein ACXWLB_07670 [Reyranella sp.]